TGARCSKTSCAQFNASGSSSDPASAGHGTALGKDERLVLRFLEHSNHCKYYFGCAHNNTLCCEFCTACSARTQDSGNIKPRVPDKCVCQLCVTTRHYTGIRPFRPRLR